MNGLKWEQALAAIADRRCAVLQSHAINQSVDLD
jgi:hypothetical protein